MYYAILYMASTNTSSLESLAMSIIAAAIAASMSVKQDLDNKYFRGIFHRTWITHSLAFVVLATAATYMVMDYVLKPGDLTLYITLAAFCATFSHVTLDSLTKRGVPLFGPFDDKMRGLRMFRGSSQTLNILFLAAGVIMALIYYGLFDLARPDLSELLRGLWP